MPIGLLRIRQKVRIMSRAGWQKLFTYRSGLIHISDSCILPKYYIIYLQVLDQADGGPAPTE
jgi:hypothetical protein